MKKELKQKMEEAIKIRTQSHKIMPQWRKLSMGIQGQLDDFKTNVNRAPEDLSSQCDGSTTTFTVSKNIESILWVYLDGTMLAVGNEITAVSGKNITLSFAPSSGETLLVNYI